MDDGLRVLLVADQNPFDPASGAARNARSIAELLAGRCGFAVRAVGSGRTEGARSEPTTDLLDRAGVQSEPDPRLPATLGLLHAGVRYRLIESGGCMTTAPTYAHRRRLDAAFDLSMAELSPQIVLGYGGDPATVHRYTRARALGAKVVALVMNHGYVQRAFFDAVDAVLTPSAYLAKVYAAALGIRATPVPDVIDPTVTLATTQQRVFATFINPSREKGLMFIARFCDEIGLRRPDIPVMVVESRGTAGGLVAAGREAGFDLRRHQNIYVTPPTPHPRDIFAVTRVLLVPSVWHEPSGRVAAEALINGIPPLVSDRGGLSEQVGAAGQVLPLPCSYTPSAQEPLEREAVAPWIAALEVLFDDKAAYNAACTAALEEGRRFAPNVAAERYVDLLRTIAKSASG